MTDDSQSTSLVKQIENVNRTFLTTVSNFIINRKKTFIGLSLVVGVGYWAYRRYLKDHIDVLLELKKLTEKMNVEGEEDNNKSVYQAFEATFTGMLNKLLINIEKQIQAVYSVDEIHKQVVDKEVQRSREERERLWFVLKARVICSLVSSVTVSRTILILSQTHLLLLERYKHNTKNMYSKAFYDNILNDLWSLALRFIEHLLKSFENKLTKHINENLSLKFKYSAKDIKFNFNQYRELTEVIKVNGDCYCKNDNLLNNNSTMNNDNSNNKDKTNNGNYDQGVSLEFLSFYLNLLEQKISSYEETELNVQFEEENLNIFGTIKFLSEYYDVINSSLTTIVLQKALDNDYEILFDLIEKNYENVSPDSNDRDAIVSISMPKIISFLLHIKNTLMNSETTILTLKNYKESTFTNDLESYLSVLYNIH